MRKLTTVHHGKVKRAGIGGPLLFPLSLQCARSSSLCTSTVADFHTSPVLSCFFSGQKTRDKSQCSTFSVSPMECVGLRNTASDRAPRLTVMDAFTITLTPSGTKTLDGSDFTRIDTSSASEVFVCRSFSMTCMINGEEPGVWGLEVKLVLKVGSLPLTVKQHTEGRLADSRSMMDLSVDGLDAVDSVGDWLGVGTPGQRRWGFYPSRVELDEASRGVDAVDELLLAGRCGS